MSYQVHNFQSGAVLLASQLNEMDNQIALNESSSVLKSSIANEFSTSSTYAVGDYVIYEGQLYQCITAVTTAGSWNSSNWTQAVLGNDVGDLKSATNDSLFALTGGSAPYDWDSGTTRDLPNVLTQVSYANWASVLVPCQEGDVFSVKGSGGNISRLWVFANSSGASIASSETQAKVSDYVQITAPAGTAYLACNSRTNDEYTPSLVKGTVVKTVLRETQKEINSTQSSIYTPLSNPLWEYGLIGSDGIYSTQTSKTHITHARLICFNAGDVIQFKNTFPGNYTTKFEVYKWGDNNRSAGTIYSKDLLYLEEVTVVIPSAGRYRIYATKQYSVLWTDEQKTEFDSDLTISLLKTDTWAILSKLSNAPIDAYLASGGDMTPNNRIKHARFYVKAGDVVFFDTSRVSKNICFAVTTYDDLTTTDTKLDDFGWVSGHGIYVLPTSGYADILYAGYRDTVTFTSATECDDCSFYIITPIDNGVGGNDAVENEIANARQVPGTSSTIPLTLLHLSDPHGDSVALTRILSEYEKLSGLIDGIICTGDMVPNTGEAISSWWDSRVMTCVGNHDTATYSNGAYNWTAVSMANRDAYYIAPFESNWGITHTSGKSYYYKDYSTQKVRLIVMDGMLYTDNGADATAQTSWLESLLADAITNNLHVLIAIHAAHGGGSIETCTFSQLGANTYPTYSDCNTPQTVIDTVAAKITGGLKFIGYIVGHEHKDYIVDATGDGTQMMYCVTCAITSQKAQWQKSDMDRHLLQDAYNIVTIDTDHTLVKIVRGGGANISNAMIPRKGICFDYSTGSKVGEVL